MNNEKNKYWFKRRRYGWGWIPVTWQGWIVLLVGIGLIFLGVLQFPLKPAHPSFEQVIFYLIEVFVVVAIIVTIAYKKSPKPHWRWGKRPDDNPDEDF